MGKNCDSKELFTPYKIAKCDSYEKYLNQYNVIMLNIQDFLSMTESVGEMLSFLQMRVIKELKKQYPDVISEDERLLTIALEDVYSETGEAFVFIIDEWDCMLRDKSYHADDQKKYLDFIRNLLKDKAYVALAYMTGILPIKKYGTHSALKIYIDLNYDGLKDAIIEMLAGQHICIHTERFQNDMTTFESRDDVLTLLVHLGYLAYDSESSEVFISNTEIQGEFRNAVRISSKEVFE